MNPRREIAHEPARLYLHACQALSSPLVASLPPTARLGLEELALGALPHIADSHLASTATSLTGLPPGGALGVAFQSHTSAIIGAVLDRLGAMHSPGPPKALTPRLGQYACADTALAVLGHIQRHGHGIILPDLVDTLAAALDAQHEALIGALEQAPGLARTPHSAHWPDTITAIWKRPPAVRARLLEFVRQALPLLSEADLDATAYGATSEHPILPLALLLRLHPEASSRVIAQAPHALKEQQNRFHSTVLLERFLDTLRSAHGHMAIRAWDWALDDLYKADAAAANKAARFAMGLPAHSDARHARKVEAQQARGRTAGPRGGTRHPHAAP